MYIVGYTTDQYIVERNTLTTSITLHNSHLLLLVIMVKQDNMLMHLKYNIVDIR